MDEGVQITGFQSGAKSGLSKLGNLFMPPICLACDRRVDEQGVVCPQCWSGIRFIEKPYCAVMGSPFSYELGEGAMSARAIAKLPPFDKARSVILYDEVARRLVQGLKFSDRLELAPWMARWMVRASDGILADNAIVVPVPLHRWRLFGRRFNQSAELARHISSRMNLRYAPEMLKRIRATRQQVGLGRSERDKNVRGAFRVPKDLAIEVKGQHIVLIDDVFTTGATLEACARALKRRGAAQVDCLTFARVANGVAVNEV